MKLYFNVFSLAVLCLFSTCLLAQDSTKKWYHLSNFYGGIESNIQYYVDDNKTGSIAPVKKMASNTYFNLNYSFKFIEAGIQVENYNPRLQGYSSQYDSITKLVHRFVRFKHKLAQITIGNFYEQFGQGYLFRAYEERQLGIDNIINGVQAIITPIKQLRVKSFYGKQRNFMTLSPANIFGIDGEYDIANLGKNKNTLITLGFGYIQKKQTVDIPLPNFPSTINAFGARLKLTNNRYNVTAEYVSKSIEPDFQNAYIYKKGSTFLLTQSYTSPKGWGANITLRRLENMDFKSNYSSTDAVASLNYLPALTKQQSYLVANIYPYNTQWLAEIGGQADYFYYFKKKSTVGGKYGAKLAINFSTYYNLDTARIGNTKNFTSKAIAVGKQKLFSDINISFEKRWTKTVKSTLTYIHLYYNKPILQEGSVTAVKADMVIADVTFKLNSTLSLRTELQHLSTKNDNKNWAAALIELNTSKGLSFFASDLIDYQTNKINYYNIGAAFNKNAFRILLNVSRQRAGLICIGGLCRYSPSFTGVNASISYNF